MADVNPAVNPEAIVLGPGAVIRVEGREPSELPESFKSLAREKMEEALAMYERGDPLWIRTSCGTTGFGVAGIEVIVTVKELWA